MVAKIIRSGRKTPFPPVENRFFHPVEIRLTACKLCFAVHVHWSCLSVIKLHCTALRSIEALVHSQENTLLKGRHLGKKLHVSFCPCRVLQKYCLRLLLWLLNRGHKHNFAIFRIASRRDFNFESLIPSFTSSF